MIKTVKYSEIESVTYKFTEYEVMQALIKSNNIKIGNNEYEIELYENNIHEDGTHEKSYVEITVHYKEVKNEKKGKDRK